MDPFSIGLMMASTALTSFGKLSAAGAQASADYDEGIRSLHQADLYGINADIAKTNVGLMTTQAEIAGLGEDFAYNKARLQKGRIIEKGRETLAAQHAEFSSRNIDPTFGSPLLTQALTAGRIAQDLDLTDAGAAVEAADAKTRKANIQGQVVNAQGQVVSNIGNQLNATLRAKSLFTKSDDDITAGVIGAVSSILGGAGKMAGGFSGGGEGGVAGTMNVGGSSYVAYGA